MPSPLENSPERIAEAIRAVPVWYHTIAFDGGAESPGYSSSRSNCRPYWITTCPSGCAKNFAAGIRLRNWPRSIIKSSAPVSKRRGRCSGRK